MATEDDALVADLTGHLLSGILAGTPSLPEDEAIEKAIRMAEETAALLSSTAPEPPEPGPPTGLTVLTPHDFTYLGWAGLPLDEPNRTRFGYSTGALSGRVITVEGKDEIRFFVTGAQADTGWNDPVYEVAWHGPGARCTLVTNWGDVTQGQRVSAAGNALPIHGLLWDEKTQQLLWTYLDQYNVTGQNDPCLGATTLHAAGRHKSGLTVAGPWRMSDHAMRVGGYLVALPAWLQDLLGGKRFAAGAPIGSGNASAPWGPFQAAFALPAPGTPPDVVETPNNATIPTTHLIYSDIDHRQPRTPDADECGWTHYGESDSHGDQPQWNPKQDGTGCTPYGELCGASFAPLDRFGAMDTISAAAWVAGKQKHGLVLVGQLARTLAAHAAEYGKEGRCHVWYGPPQVYNEKKLCAHGQNDQRYGGTSTGPGCTTMQSSLFIWDPDDLAAVIRGTVPATCLPPAVDAFDMSQLTHSGTPPFPQLATAMAQYGGAWWEPKSQTLFVSAAHAEWQGEWRPVVHAFKVAA